MTDTVTLPRSVVEQVLQSLHLGIAMYPNGGTAAVTIQATIDALRAALDQPQDPSEQHLDMVPAGWKLVPVEPTDEMREAGKDAHYEAETRTSDADAWSLTGFAHRVVRASYIYRAMLAAAPQPPVVEQPQSVTNCHQSQPQGGQEPVAWMDAETRVLYDHDTSEVDLHHGFKPTVPLYTHPQPKREPLTEDEIAELMMRVWGCASIAPRQAPSFARAIERAHRIGGDA